MVRQRKVAIVVDSSACLPHPLTEELDIAVVPFELQFHGKVYRDGVDIQPEEFYQLLKRNDGVPTTSAPKPASFVEAFQRASEWAESILCLTLSPNFSATYDSARVAAEMAVWMIHRMMMATVGVISTLPKVGTTRRRGRMRGSVIAPSAL